MSLGILDGIRQDSTKFTQPPAQLLDAFSAKKTSKTPSKGLTNHQEDTNSESFQFPVSTYATEQILRTVLGLLCIIDPPPAAHFWTSRALLR